MSVARAFASALLVSAALWAMLALAFCHAARADPVAVTLGTSPAQLVPGTGKSMRLISVDNESTTATIAVCFGYNPSTSTTPCTPALNTAGSYTLGPGVTRLWTAADTTFFGPVYGVSSAAGTPVTINYQ